MSGKTLTSSLIVRLIDQVSAPARKVAGSLLGLQNSAKNANATFGQRLGSAIERNNKALAATRGQLFDAAAGFYVLKNAIGGPVKAAMEFESAMADVKKVVDFPTPKALLDFQQGLVDLSKRVPLSVNGLAAIAAAAGQAGIAGDDLNKFTEAAAKIGVAFDITADQAGDAMAKLMTGLGLSIDQVVLLSDAMNHLSNAQASSASDILDVVRRVGAQAKQFGFTAEQVAAFGSAMVSSGAETDVAATSFRNMGLALTKGAAATKGQRRAYAALGLDAKKVAKSMQKDAVGTTLDVMERISKLPKYQQAAISSELFGNEARALPILLTNLKLLRESLGLVDNQAKYAGSAFKEFDVRAKTFQNATQIFQNRLEALKIVIGAALIPALNDLIDKVSPIVENITQWAQANPELVKGIIEVSAALIGFKVALIGLKFAGLLGRGGALAILSTGFNTVGRAAISLYRGAAGMLALQGALAAMSGANYSGIAKTMDAIKGMALAVPGVSAIGAALSAVGAALATISAPVWGAIAVGVAAVAVAGSFLWKYWDRITSVLSGVGRAIGEILAPALDRVRPALDFLAPVGEAIAAGWEKAKQVISDFGNWIGSFFQREVLSEDQKAQWENAGHDAAMRMVEAIKSAFAGLVQWAASIGSQIGSAIADGAISAVNRVKGWFGGGSTPSADGSAPPSGHRARGGRVWSGGSFVVGENGPERFTPGTSGTITPNGGDRGGSISVGPFHITGASDPVATAREVARIVKEEINRGLRGSHADMPARP